jgi:DNA-binding NarL/FixJ family response regulator
MRYLIVDDHPMLREGVAAVLRQGGDAVEVLFAESGARAMEVIQQPSPIDVVFLDVVLPGTGGLNVLKEIGVACPDLPVIMLSSSEDPTDVRRALALGALGYVPKSASSTTLLAALKLVLSGEIYVPPFLAKETPVPGAPTGALAPILTERQSEVLVLLADDKSNKEIAYALQLSEKTVKAHVTAIFRALNVTNRAEAGRAAKAQKA